MGGHSGTRYFLLTALLTASLAAQDVLDVQRVPLTADPSVAVVHVTVPDRVQEVRCDVLVAGAGMGGAGSALSIANRGHSVCLTEETDWLGGQATSGGVSALDENKFIEFAGGTRSYMAFRQGIREWYRQHRKLTAEASAWENFNPGFCYVSALCFEPKVAVDVLDRMLAKPGIRVFKPTAIFAIDRKGARILSALAWQFDKHQAIRFVPRFVLDATEMGDLLPLAHIPYVVGAEARGDTAEPDAHAQPNPACVQSFTYPFVLEQGTGNAAIVKPVDYEQIRKRQGFTFKVNYPAEVGLAGGLRVPHVRRRPSHSQ